MEVSAHVAFEAERRLFQRLRTGLQEKPDVLQEFVAALHVLVNEYSTTIRENRFIVGGAAERLVAVAMRAIGINAARSRGLSLDEEDIVVGDAQLSVKSTFSRGFHGTRLKNALGTSRRSTWRVGTIFVLGGRGVAYADPGHLGAEVQRTADALVLPGRALKAHLAAHPELLLQCEIPTKPKDSYGSRAASEVVMRDVLTMMERGTARFPQLRGHM
jgi:hypothetical protein